MHIRKFLKFRLLTPFQIVWISPGVYWKKIYFTETSELEQIQELLDTKTVSTWQTTANSSLYQWWDYSCFTRNTSVPLQFPKTYAWIRESIRYSSFTLSSEQCQLHRGWAGAVILSPRDICKRDKKHRKTAWLAQELSGKLLTMTVLCKVLGSAVFSCAYRIKTFLSARADI